MCIKRPEWIKLPPKILSVHDFTDRVPGWEICQVFKISNRLERTHMEIHPNVSWL